MATRAENLGEEGASESENDVIPLASTPSHSRVHRQYPSSTPRMPLACLPLAYRLPIAYLGL